MGDRFAEARCRLFWWFSMFVYGTDWKINTFCVFTQLPKQRGVSNVCRDNVSTYVEFFCTLYSLIGLTDGF